MEYLNSPVAGSSLLFQDDRNVSCPVTKFQPIFIPGKYVSVGIPEVVFRGVSLLATHTTVVTDMFLYHMPTYRFSDLPGLKNPSSKVPLDETMVVFPLPSFTERVAVMVSVEQEIL
nr:hypothetical protein CR513_16898 [Ipomoea trifida]